jgi:DNA-binding transcriptional LysR family regulator
MSGFYYKQNRLKQLRAFCYAARTGSISKAAEQLFLSQPSVSLLIQALEGELHSQLFERQGPKIRLTKPGSILLDMALPLLESLDSLPDAFHERCYNLVTGSLSLAAGESTTLYLLPDVVKRYMERYPQVHLKLSNVPGKQGLALVRAGEVDFAVGPILEIPDDIYYLPLVSFEPILITPLDHPLCQMEKVTLDDIGPYGLIMPPPSMSTRNIIDVVFQQHDFKYKVLMEAGGWEVIKKYVETGVGIAIVTSICLTGKEKISRISLADYFPARSYGIILRRGKFISPAARRFIEIMAPDALHEWPRMQV